MHQALKTMIKDDTIRIRILTYGGQIKWEQLT